MPHRSQYRRDISGWAIVVGLYCIFLGITWFLFPTNSRVAGVEWINESAFPISTLSSHHVAAWWMVGGAFSVVGGVLGKYKPWGMLSVVASIFFPSIASVIFFGSWVDNHTGPGLVFAGSYLFPAVVMIYAICRGAYQLRKGVIEISIPDVTGR